MFSGATFFASRKEFLGLHEHTFVGGVGRHMAL